MGQLDEQALYFDAVAALAKVVIVKTLAAASLQASP